jgi:SPP1 family predicted phage head-tail adaptor
VTIQNVTRVQDGQGGYTESWSDVATVWCSIEPVKAWERYQAAQLATPVSHKVVMRYTSAVTSASRLKFGDRYLGVKEVINRDEQSRFLDIKCIEVESISIDTETLYILLEGGFSLLLEDGSNLLQEAA